MDSNQDNLMTLDPTRLSELREVSEDGSFLIEILNLFESFCPPLIGELVILAGRGDVKGVVDAAHSLKSSAANIGATRLSVFVHEPRVERA